jgi:hypothetical protein
MELTHAGKSAASTITKIRFLAVADLDTLGGNKPGAAYRLTGGVLSVIFRSI